MTNKIRFAVIGTGVIARIHSEAIKAIGEAELSCVYSRTAETGKQFAAEFQCDYTIDIEQIVKNPDIDAVAICTPSGTHADLVVLAARHGKHVIVEKPLDISLAKADKAIAACRENDVKLCSIFQLRFMRETGRVKKMMEEGSLGKLIQADAYMKFYRSESYYANSNWKGTKGLDGGGALMNQGIHGIDLLLWLAGPVASVTAQVRALKHDIEVEDTAVALVNFQNGALGVIQGATSIYPDHPQLLAFHGTDGTLELAGTEVPYIKRLELLNRPDLNVAEQQTPKDHLGEAHRLQFLDFIESILTNREPLVNGEEGRRALELVEAIYRSSEQKRTIQL